MLKVACVLKSGGIYDASWVARLRAGVEKHLSERHRFVCLSDVDVPCDRIPLEHDWPGWWSKLEALRIQGPVLLLDLDTAIVGDMSDIAGAAEASRFMMLRDFYAPDHCGSGVMAWGGSPPSHLYERFAAAPDLEMKTRRARMGDQAFIEEAYGLARIERWQAVIDDQIVSYKVHCQHGIPMNARIVALHGKPKFFDMPANDPVRLAWELAA